MVNDHQFIYSRIECEFSGTYTLQIVDLFDMTQEGVRLGLDEKDELEYVMYTGKGELIGQIATFEVFGNNNETRGPRRVYRPLETFETHDRRAGEDAVLNKAHAFGDGAGQRRRRHGRLQERAGHAFRRQEARRCAWKTAAQASNTTSSTASS